jgi:hypothetical protein
LFGLLILIAFISRGGRATLAACRDSLADSAKSALTVGMACAIVGTIIGMMTQTGVGTIFGSWIIGLGAKSLFLALVMTMLLSILLGTGIPTIPTYIITAALAAPALAKLGVPLIASHMFAFYYGIMADSRRRWRWPHLLPRPDRRRKIPTRSAGKRCACARRLRHPLHLRLFAGADAAGRRSHGGTARLLRRVALATVKALSAIGLFGVVAIGFCSRGSAGSNRVLRCSPRSACSATSSSATPRAFARRRRPALAVAAALAQHRGAA